MVHVLEWFFLKVIDRRMLAKIKEVIGEMESTSTKIDDAYSSGCVDGFTKQWGAQIND